MNKKDLVLSLPQRLFLFVCIFIVGFAITVGASYILARVLSNNPAGALRVSSIVQDVFAFIVPAVATAVLVTRRPADLLCLRGGLSLTWIFLVGAVLFFCIPLQEGIIYWNQNITLPDSLADFERAIRTMEAQAEAASRIMMSNTSVPALIVNILIIGVAAGVAEELLFRGCFQRLLVTGGINHHVAIWTVAFIFSFIHFQFFGFVPRLLLGAYFGYLLYWSGSVWIPAIAHALNNTLVVITTWHHLVVSGSLPSSSAVLPPVWLIIASLILTGATIALMYRLSHLKKTACQGE